MEILWISPMARLHASFPTLQSVALTIFITAIQDSIWICKLGLINWIVCHTMNARTAAGRLGTHTTRTVSTFTKDLAQATLRNQYRLAEHPSKDRNPSIGIDSPYPLFLHSNYLENPTGP
jgi:hypothetical protein